MPGFDSQNGMTTIHILYLVHDLCDPAVGRRVAMLQAGGATVSLAGFRRAAQLPVYPDLTPIDLGETADRAFGQRLVAIGKAALSLRAKLRGTARPDIIIGRNMEMLALANRTRTLFGGAAPVVYECLDIHRLLLDQGAMGMAMRSAERLLARDASLLLTSSPAFVRSYFEAYQQLRTPVALLQNKMLELSEGALAPASPAALPKQGEAWKIGWFGALRCAKSLDLLAAFTRRMEGRFEIVLRGRPAYVEFADFDSRVASEPHMRFDGPYRNPQDLAAIYGEVHFAWAIDFFEEGLNSSWLLPNRLYEGCRFGAVPIAVAGTETANFLAEHNLGLRLDRPTVDGLTALLGDLTARDYLALRQQVVSEDLGTWTCRPADCRALVEQLMALAGGRPELAEAA